MPTRIAISNTFNVSTIEDGVSAPYVVLSRSVILYNANPNGESTSSQSFAITYSLRVANNLIPSSSITNVNITSLTGVSVSNKTNSGCTLICANGATTNGVITITMYGTYEGVAYNASANISIAPNRKGQEGEQGQTGQRGKIGRFFYYAGVFNQADDDKKFPINDAQAPYFEHTDESQIKRYHVFDPEQNPEGEELSMAEMWAATGGWNIAPWRIMYDDFKYLITEAIFGNFAHFGSAIISGDWMLSQHGTINGVASTDYTKFDPEHPNDSVNNGSGYNFVPNYCVDLLTGSTYQHEAYIAGAIHAQSLSTEFKDVQYTSSDETYYVNLDASYEPKNEKYWNYRFIPSSIDSQMTVILPTNKFASYGQRVILYNTGFGFGGGQEIIVNSCEVDNEGITTKRPLLGLSLEPYSPSPTPIHTFEPVDTIFFVNGIVELVCVPPVEEEVGVLCDWAVSNIGTNFYRLEAYQQ